MKESLKALREKNNYSQATVAKYLGISRQMYIKYESGEAEPPVKVIVALSKLYKVDYAQIIDNAAGSHIAKENIYDNSRISGNLCVASPSVAYGSSSHVVMNNNFELIKTIIPKLNIFEQLQILSLLASSIEKNGANEIVNLQSNKLSPKEKSKLNNLSKKEKDELFQKFSGCLKGGVVEDPKDARLEHVYKKYKI
ncbi:MAG: helix-turn-helix transcriptional regulator [Spirochaetia bacterium]|nr:helix-turn-helix transcriptional regulator [Spirochaetia bacterium]